MLANELSDSQPDLHRVNPWIRRGQSRIRNVHESQFEADIMLLTKDVHAQCRLVRKVHGVCSSRDVVIGEQRSAAEFEIGRKPAAALEVPLQRQRIEPYAVSGIGRLEDEEYRNRIDGIFEPATENSRKMRVGEDPSIAQACVESASVRRAAGDRVTSASPDLHFVAAAFWSSLRGTETRCERR